MQRFWSKVDNTGDGCWVWLKSVGTHGYGTFWLDGKQHKAHRVAWMLLNGDAGDLDVLHTCDNSLCVRPSHLYLGTDLDNAGDRVARGRSFRPAGVFNAAYKHGKYTGNAARWPRHVPHLFQPLGRGPSALGMLPVPQRTGDVL